MEDTETVIKLLEVLNKLTNNYSDGNEVSDLANKKIIEILRKL